MQAEVQKHLKNKTKPKHELNEEQVDNYKRLQLSEFQDIIDSANPYVRPPHMGKLIETMGDDVIGRALIMGPINCQA
jgi:hypothetical protein